MGDDDDQRRSTPLFINLFELRGFGMNPDDVDDNDDGAVDHAAYGKYQDMNGYYRVNENVKKEEIGGVHLYFKNRQGEAEDDEDYS